MPEPLVIEIDGDSSDAQQAFDNVISQLAQLNQAQEQAARASINSTKQAAQEEIVALREALAEKIAAIRAGSDLDEKALNESIARERRAHDERADAERESLNNSIDSARQRVSNETDASKKLIQSAARSYKEQIESIKAVAATEKNELTKSLKQRQEADSQAIRSAEVRAAKLGFSFVSEADLQIKEVQRLEKEFQRAAGQEIGQLITDRGISSFDRDKRLKEIKERIRAEKEESEELIRLIEREHLAKIVAADDARDKEIVNIKLAAVEFKLATEKKIKNSQEARDELIQDSKQTTAAQINESKKFLQQVRDESAEQIRTSREKSRSIINAETQIADEKEKTLRESLQLTRLEASAAIRASRNTVNAVIRNLQLKTAAQVQSFLNERARGKAQLAEKKKNAAEELRVAKNNARSEEKLERDKARKIQRFRQRIALSAKNLAFTFLGVGDLQSVARFVFESTLEIERLREALEALLGSAQLANREFETLLGLARLPGISLTGAADAAVKLRAIGIEGERAHTIVRELGNALALTGQPESSTRLLIRAIAQIEGRGKVQQEEINQLIEPAPILGSALRRAFGSQNAEQIRAVTSDTEDFINRFVVELKQLDRAFDDSLQNTLDNFGIELKNFSAEIGNIFEPSARSVLQKGTDILKDLTKRMQDAAKASKILRSATDEVSTGIGKLIGSFIASLGKSFARFVADVATFPRDFFRTIESTVRFGDPTALIRYREHLLSVQEAADEQVAKNAALASSFAKTSEVLNKAENALSAYDEKQKEVNERQGLTAAVYAKSEVRLNALRGAVEQLNSTLDAPIDKTFENILGESGKALDGLVEKSNLASEAVRGLIGELNNTGQVDLDQINIDHVDIDALLTTLSRIEQFRIGAFSDISGNEQFRDLAIEAFGGLDDNELQNVAEKLLNDRKASASAIVDFIIASNNQNELITRYLGEQGAIKLLTSARRAGILPDEQGLIQYAKNFRDRLQDEAEELDLRVRIKTLDEIEPSLDAFDLEKLSQDADTAEKVFKAVIDSATNLRGVLTQSTAIRAGFIDIVGDAIATPEDIKEAAQTAIKALKELAAAEIDVARQETVGSLGTPEDIRKRAQERIDLIKRTGDIDEDYKQRAISRIQEIADAEIKASQAILNSSADLRADQLSIEEDYHDKYVKIAEEAEKKITEITERERNRRLTEGLERQKESFRGRGIIDASTLLGPVLEQIPGLSSSPEIQEQLSESISKILQDTIPEFDNLPLNEIQEQFKAIFDVDPTDITGSLVSGDSQLQLRNYITEVRESISELQQILSQPFTPETTLLLEQALTQLLNIEVPENAGSEILEHYNNLSRQVEEIRENLRQGLPEGGFEGLIDSLEIPTVEATIDPKIEPVTIPTVEVVVSPVTDPVTIPEVDSATSPIPEPDRPTEPAEDVASPVPKSVEIDPIDTSPIANAVRAFDALEEAIRNVNEVEPIEAVVSPIPEPVEPVEAVASQAPEPVEAAVSINPIDSVVTSPIANAVKELGALEEAIRNVNEVEPIEAVVSQISEPVVSPVPEAVGSPIPESIEPIRSIEPVDTSAVDSVTNSLSLLQIAIQDVNEAAKVPNFPAFEKILARVRRHEGGLDTTDPRGENYVSYAGILQRTYNEFLSRQDDRQSLPSSVRSLPNREDVIERFYRDYFEQFNFSDIPDPLRYSFTDLAVNAGSGVAVKILQRILDVEEDGSLGPNTRAAIQSFTDKAKKNPTIISEAISQYNENREQFYVNLVNRDLVKFATRIAQSVLSSNPLDDVPPPSMAKYLRGWLNRTEEASQFALRDLQAALDDGSLAQGPTSPMREPDDIAVPVANLVPEVTVTEVPTPAEMPVPPVREPVSITAPVANVIPEVTVAEGAGADVASGIIDLNKFLSDLPSLLELSQAGLSETDRDFRKLVASLAAYLVDTGATTEEINKFTQALLNLRQETLSQNRARVQAIASFTSYTEAVRFSRTELGKLVNLVLSERQSAIKEIGDSAAVATPQLIPFSNGIRTIRLELGKLVDVDIPAIGRNITSFQDLTPDEQQGVFDEQIRIINARRQSDEAFRILSIQTKFQKGLAAEAARVQNEIVEDIKKTEQFFESELNKLGETDPLRDLIEKQRSSFRQTGFEEKPDLESFRTSFNDIIDIARNFDRDIERIDKEIASENVLSLTKEELRNTNNNDIRDRLLQLRNDVGSGIIDIPKAKTELIELQEIFRQVKALREQDVRDEEQRTSKVQGTVSNILGNALQLPGQILFEIPGNQEESLLELQRNFSNERQRIQNDEYLGRAQREKALFQLQQRFAQRSADVTREASELKADAYKEFARSALRSIAQVAAAEAQAQLAKSITAGIISAAGFIPGGGIAASLGISLGASLLASSFHDPVNDRRAGIAARTRGIQFGRQSASDLIQHYDTGFAQGLQISTNQSRSSTPASQSTTNNSKSNVTINMNYSGNADPISLGKALREAIDNDYIPGLGKDAA